MHTHTKDGHVYICNLKIMEGLQCRKGYYCCAPMCLLYVNGSDQLVPIAIQLNQKPGDENPIFLPSDHLMDWLMAKIYYQSAHLQVTQIAYNSWKIKESVCHSMTILLLPHVRS